MVAACYNAVMLPKRTSFLRHEKEIALQLPQQLFFAPSSPQAFQPQIVADKRLESLLLHKRGSPSVVGQNR